MSPDPDLSRTDGAASAARRELRSAVLAWYAREHRDFPWRGTRDPYAVLVSEVMLQQTQAARVTVAFPRFLHRFPTATALADASEAEVLAAWSGLGYNRRALALRRVAQAVAEHGWPRSVGELEALPGIGPYTARALASLAFEQAVGVVDTNVRRWLIRRFGLPLDTRPAALQALANELAAPGARDRRTDAWTHASMEFGAAICTARRPRCDACPVADGCPSCGRAVAVPVPRQAPFTGSEREARGSLLRALAQAPGHALSTAAARRQVGAGGLERIVESLERDGLAHRSDDQLRLGGPPPRGAATIGP